MRVQHNIMAMSAYRNYTNNVSAMKKNLERLSSGYKINRAGDDAAGLAISEKMRAQITGLETASKNAKDGISLVQTAEGALQEVHDMLNRMVELATQSANGTYDNTTDRDQLQKELNQLRSEINRIADGANFNGIKLLDGSMDANGFVNGTGSTSDLINWAAAGTAGASLLLPTVSTNAAGWNNTVLHAGATTGSGTEFSADLHEVKFDAREGDELTITIGTGNASTGGATIKLEVTKAQSGPLTADQIVDAIVGGTNPTTGFKVTINGQDFTSGGKIQIKGTDFTLKKGAAGRLSFTQESVPSKTENEVLGNMSVTVTCSKAGTGVTLNDGASLPTSAVTTNGTTASTAAVYTYDLSGIKDVGKGTYTVSIAGQTVEITLSDDDNTATAVAAAIVTKLNALKASDATLFLDGMDGATATSTYTIANTGGKITFTASAQNVASVAGDPGTPAVNATPISGSFSIGYKDAADRTAAKIVTGDYNKQTTDVKNVASGGVARIASTSISLSADMFKNDCSFYIGGTTYTITTDETKKNDPNTVYIGDLLNSAKTQVSNANLAEACRRLSDAAAGNDVWTVGVGGTAGQITLVEKTNAQGVGVGSDNWKNKADNTGKLDLTTIEGIAKSLGYKGADVDPTAGKALTLQIGDTAEDFNQLKVNIKDCHTDAMKDAETGKSLAEISIANQEDAATAVDVIKAAINYVSDVRGTLGATQNRLDHTINNLSVMTENIQDAESTIRDTDIAEEMMAYTKNNILIQASQAMLAQANQVPQGVLQLLQ